MVAPPRSAYLHIPFCHKRCFYCDFSIIPLGDSAQAPDSPGITSINAYLDLLHREISIAPIGPADPIDPSDPILILMSLY